MKPRSMLRAATAASLALLLAFAAPGAARAQETDGFATARGVRIHYRTVGDGPPLLLINGGPGWSSAHMLPVARRLADARRVILFDQRGTGESVLRRLDSTTVTMRAMVDDIDALRRHLGIERWDVMGHSFGGMLAMAYAAAYPERVSSMVLSAPGGADLSLLDYYEASLADRLLPWEREAAAFWSDPERMGAAPKHAAYEIARATVGAFLYDRARLPDLLAVLDEDTWSIPVSNLVWGDLARTDFDVRDSMRRFHAPVLVVQGRQDALGALHARQIADLFDHAEFRIIEEAAHLMWLDQEAEYYDVVRGFLGRGS